MIQVTKFTPTPQPPSTFNVTGLSMEEYSTIRLALSHYAQLAISETGKRGPLAAGLVQTLPASYEVK